MHYVTHCTQIERLTHKTVVLYGFSSADHISGTLPGLFLFDDQKYLRRDYAIYSESVQKLSIFLVFLSQEYS